MALRSIAGCRDGCDRRLRGSGIEGKYVVLNM